MRIYFVITLIFLSSWARAEDWPQAVWVPSHISSLDEMSPKVSVSQDEFLTDLAFLQRAMQAGYGGWSVNGDALTAAFDRLRSVTGFPLSSQQICELIGQEFDEIPDGHLAISYAGHTCGKSAARGQVGKNISTKTWEYFENIKGTGVSAIAITSMAWRDSTVWNGFLSQIDSLKTNAKALIIDLRGNGGGDMEKAQQMARRLFGIDDESVQISPAFTGYLAHTAEGFAIAGNTNLFNITIAALTGSQVRQGDAEMYKYYLDKYNDVLAGNSPKDFVQIVEPFVFDNAKIFQGPIRILVDRECASSCEWATMFFERHPHAKVVGENTFGAFHFDNVGMVWLRQTNLFVGIPTVSVDFVSGHAVSQERSGMQPNIKVFLGEDALDVALKDIRETLR